MLFLAHLLKLVILSVILNCVYQQRQKIKAVNKHIPDYADCRL